MVEFPGADLALVLPVEEDAEALATDDEVGNAEPVEREGAGTEVTRFAGEGKHEGRDGGEGEDGDGEGAEEEDTRLVAVAEGPADEIWVGLVPQGELKGFQNWREGAGVGSMLEGV